MKFSEDSSLFYTFDNNFSVFVYEVQDVLLLMDRIRN